jgi:hypothetical protein
MVIHLALEFAMYIPYSGASALDTGTFGPVTCNCVGMRP